MKYHVYYFRYHVPYLDETGDIPIERMAKHPFGIVVATQATIKEGDVERDIVQFGISLCNGKDVFDKSLARFIAQRRLTRPTWHPEHHNSGRPMGGYVPYIEGEPSWDLAGRIMETIVHEYDKPQSYYEANPGHRRVHKFARPVRDAAEMWLDQHPFNDDTIPSQEVGMGY